MSVEVEGTSCGGRISRRQLLNSAASGAAAAMLPSLGMTSGLKARSGRPNILHIITDQQCAFAMSCTGNRWLKTPNLDALAARGVRFERAYTAQPVCVANQSFCLCSKIRV